MSHPPTVRARLCRGISSDVSATGLLGPMSTRHLKLHTLLVVLVSGFAPGAAAQVFTPQGTPTEAADSAAQAAADSVGLEGPVDPAELEAWLDGYLGAYMKAENVAGATVSIVRGGELWLSKGYGFANVDERTPVDPETTLFRVGSISKLFVWTSIMQLVERGVLDLNEDVNTYLEGVEVPATYPEPVTLGHIMSHSAGFEDHVIGLFGDDVEDLRPLSELLTEQMPSRVRPPGLISSYSNHATGMAMLIVEQMSGVPWEQYIEDNIFVPLEMRHATFSQPVVDRLVGDLSEGYSYSGGFVSRDFEYVPLAPVGAASVSADDMARFMVAYLNLGQGSAGRILSESTALDVQSVRLRQAPGVNAMLHGFAEYSRNGQFAYGHGGDTQYFHSLMVLFPDHDLGIFASFNTEGGRPGPMVEAFIDRYFPGASPASLLGPSNSAGDVEAFTGLYRAARFSHTDFTKLGALVGTVEVTDAGNGALSFSNRPGARFVEMQPGLFRDEHSQETVAFRTEAGGAATNLFIDNVPYIGFERVPALERPGLHLWLLVGSAALFLLTAILWPLGGFYRRRFGVDVPEGRITFFGRLLLWLPSVLFLAFVVGAGVVLSDSFQIALGNTRIFSMLLWLPVIGGFVTVGAVAYAAVLWLTRTGTSFGRLSYTLVALAFLSFLWQLQTFNLLGWKF